MKKGLLLAGCSLVMATAQAQIPFPVHITPPGWTTQTVWMPKSPLKYQTIFVGGVDSVKTTATYGNAAGTQVAKEWHDFIGFVKDTTGGDLGWVVVNHEMTVKDDKIGDGGGMTSFKIRRLANDSLLIVPQTLPDGRAGQFFNVDFVNTTGETGMNCGGINGGNRIWTAEEWMQSSNSAIYASGAGFRDTTDFIIGSNSFAPFVGKSLKRYKNLNWMVEVDPKTGKAIRKQYNWGRAGWEGGVLMPDNKTVYLFEDGTPGILAKFVATNVNDFTDGQLFVYKHDAPTKWITIENDLDTLSELNRVAVSRGATMFNRLEWGAVYNNKVYITETGRDAFGTALSGGNAANGVISPSLVDGYKTRYQIVNGSAFPGTDADAADSVRFGRFNDYYGRVIEFDPATDMVRSYIEGGPFRAGSTSEQLPYYPDKHLSNPDGLSFLQVGNKTYMMIQEDLNGSSHNRMPAGLTNIVCEMYLLDMSIANPTINDLQRISACPPGGEITGAVALDERTILVNAQHPNTNNVAPFNHSMTYAITGFNGIKTDVKALAVNTKSFSIYPNPASRELNLSDALDVAIYNMVGQRVKVSRSAKTINVSDLSAGTYFIRSADGETLKFVVQ